MIPIREVRERLAEPLFLMRRGRADHAALHYLLEQFVAGFFERTGGRDVPLPFNLLLRHVLRNIR